MNTAESQIRTLIEAWRTRSAGMIFPAFLPIMSRIS